MLSETPEVSSMPVEQNENAVFIVVNKTCLGTIMGINVNGY